MIEAHGFPTRILIVDDHQANRDSLAMTLRFTDESFIVDTAASGEEALELLEHEPRDVVLCDLILGGGLDGIEVTRRLSDERPQIRVVVFTGQETGESKERALAAGAFAYLSKPVPHEELVHAIRTVNSIRRTERMHSWFETLTRISYDLQSSFDFDTLARRIVEGVCELGYSRARLYLFDEERQALVGKDASGMGELDFAHYEIPFEAGHVIAEIFRADRPLLLNREVLEERFRPQHEEAWLSDLDLGEITWVDCPLVVRKHRIGTLAVDHILRPKYRFTEEDRQILTVFSGLAAQALNNSRLYEQEALTKASLESILEKAPDAVVTTDLDGTINFVSPSSERVLGFSHREVEGKKAEDFYADELRTPGSGKAIAREIMEVLRHSDEEVLSNRRVHVSSRGRTPRQILLSASLLHDHDGKAIGTLGILKDLGPFADQSHHYQDVLEAFGYGMLLLSESGEITFVNRKAERLLGLGRGGLVGRSFHESVEPGQVAEVEACLERLRAKSRTEESLELQLVQPAGSRIEVTATFTLAPGKSMRRRTIVLGISDNRDLGLLVQTQRLMMLGELVAEVAHEINNPLNNMLPAIRDAQKVVAGRGWEDEELEEDLETIAEGGRRIRDIVRQLRELGRSSDFEPVPMAINQLVDDSLSFFSTRLRGQDVALELELDDSLPQVAVDRKRFLQVLLNLVINAEQAMEGVAGPKRLRIVTRLGAPGFVELSVSDSGPGIPEEVGGSIFDPFFTTKRNQGTGLGLSVSRSIVNLHRGKIRWGNVEEGRGAVITIELPFAESWAP